MFKISSMWASSIGCLAIYLCIRYYLKQPDYTKEKQQAKYVLIGLSFPVITGFITEVLFSLLRIPFPESTSPAYAIGCIFISYGISKYHLFVLTPVTATESIISTMSDFLFLAGPNGSIQWVNQTTLNMSDYSERELIDHPLTKIIADKRSESTIFKGIGLENPSRPTTIQNFETALKTKAGKIIPISLSASIIRNNMGTPIGVVYLARDISERKQVIVALRESEEKYRVILENIEDGYYEVDLAGNFTSFNDSLCRILGYSHDELMGMNNRQYMTSETAKSVYQIFNAVYRTGKSTKIFDWEVIRKDGIRRVVEGSVSLVISSTGEPTGFRGIVRDITERKKMEEALRESEAKYSTLVENAMDGVAIIQDGVLKFANQALAMMSNYSINELIARPFLDLTPLEHRNKLIQRYKALVAGEIISPFQEFKLLCKGGMLKDIEVSYEEIYYKERPAYMAVVRDITARKQAEEARQDLERRRADFIAITSHELRTPLTSIRGYSEILQQQNDLSEEMSATCVAAINRNVRRLERLITGVSTITQIERGILSVNMKDIDLCKVLTEALQPYHLFLKQQLRVQGCSESDTVIIEGDADRLLQALGNIIENAIKHTDKVNRQITVTTNILPHVVQIQVADNGAGIAAEDLERIFDPFTSIATHYSVGGAGIGLYLARILVEAHGGTLTAQSKGKDHGATFILELPRKRMGQPMNKEDQRNNGPHR